MPITIHIVYPNDQPLQAVIMTDALPEVLEQILEKWLREHLNDHPDLNPAAKRLMYRITLTYELDETFKTSSDTGNAGLTRGIILQVYAKLGRLRIRPLH